MMGLASPRLASLQRTELEKWAPLTQSTGTIINVLADVAAHEQTKMGNSAMARLRIFASDSNGQNLRRSKNSSGIPPKVRLRPPPPFCESGTHQVMSASPLLSDLGIATEHFSEVPSTDIRIEGGGRRSAHCGYKTAICADFRRVYSLAASAAETDPLDQGREREAAGASVGTNL